ncbi:MAG: OmpA family protein [Nitrospinota bacterium]|jgi:chemotaxis protein MotB|nr:OmpA family protein [Nitrospinota bacterium]MDP7371936.1 OmpA family protein [Nitrospinota bacterium]MDP7662057.1 OmpA family protein [Nitrospinota bacterium]HJP14000.1 OmpA family protein [Nitrospinota bacterium]
MGNRALSWILSILLFAGGGYFALESTNRGKALDATQEALKARKADLSEALVFAAKQRKTISGQKEQLDKAKAANAGADEKLKAAIALEREAKTRAEEVLRAAEAKVEDLNQAAGRQAAEVAGLQSALTKAKKARDSVADRLEGVASQLTNSETDIARERVKIARLEANLAGVRKESESKLEASESKLKESESKLEVSESKLKKSEADSARERKKAARLVAEMDQLRSALAGESSTAEANRNKLAKARALLNASEEGRRTALERARSTSQKARQEALRAKRLEDSLTALSKKYENQLITLSKKKGTLQLNIVDRLLFDAGSAQIKEGGLEAIDRIASAIKDQPGQAVRVDGHTDNVPISGNLARYYPTNWELSSVRAIAVVRRLEAQGVSPGRLSAAGYSFHRPAADNGTDEGRARNRRIEILMIRSGAGAK